MTQRMIDGLAALSAQLVILLITTLLVGFTSAAQAMSDNSAEVRMFDAAQGIQAVYVQCPLGKSRISECTAYPQGAQMVMAMVPACESQWGRACVVATGTAADHHEYTGTASASAVKNGGLLSARGGEWHVQLLKAGVSPGLLDQRWTLYDSQGGSAWDFRGVWAVVAPADVLAAPSGSATAQYVRGQVMDATTRYRAQMAFRDINWSLRYKQAWQTLSDHPCGGRLVVNTWQNAVELTTNDCPCAPGIDLADAGLTLYARAEKYAHELASTKDVIPASFKEAICVEYPNIYWDHTVDGDQQCREPRTRAEWEEAIRVAKTMILDVDSVNEQIMTAMRIEPGSVHMSGSLQSGMFTLTVDEDCDQYFAAQEAAAAQEAWGEIHDFRVNGYGGGVLMGESTFASTGAPFGVASVLGEGGMLLGNRVAFFDLGVHGGASMAQCEPNNVGVALAGIHAGLTTRWFSVLPRWSAGRYLGMGQTRTQDVDEDGDGVPDTDEDGNILTKEVPVGGWLSGKLGLDVRFNIPLPERYNLYLGVGTSDVVRMLDEDGDSQPESAQSRYGGQVFIGVRKSFGK